MACSNIALLNTFALLLLYAQSCACGEAEIIAGAEVRPHSLPYMVLLLNMTEQPCCGGTLLTSRWVLTAAHCIGISKVLLGVHSIEKSKNDTSVQKLAVAGSYPHPQYRHTSNVHDLQLLKLDKEAEWTNEVQYFPLANVIADPQKGTRCLVAGWGVVNPTEPKMSDVLMSVKVKVIKRDRCNSAKYYNSDPVITSDMVCAGVQGKGPDENNPDTCKGDSGGPLVCNDVQVGITAFGHGCGIRKKPGVYTFLSNDHLVWINKTMMKEKELF